MSQKPEFVCQAKVFVSNKKQLWKGLKAELKCRRQQGLREEQFRALVAAWGFKCSLNLFHKAAETRRGEISTLKIKKYLYQLPASWKHIGRDHIQLPEQVNTLSKAANAETAQNSPKFRSVYVEKLYSN